MQFTCEKYFEIFMYDNKLLDGIQVLRSVKVFEDLTYINLCRTRRSKLCSIYDGFAKRDCIVSRVYEDYDNGRMLHSMYMIDNDQVCSLEYRLPRKI